MRQAAGRLKQISRTIMSNAESEVSKPKLNVHKFPRPPTCEKTDRHLVIKWNDIVIADTKDAYWVLETTHAVGYHLASQSSEHNHIFPR